MKNNIDWIFSRSLTEEETLYWSSIWFDKQQEAEDTLMYEGYDGDFSNRQKLKNLFMEFLRLFF